MLTSNKYILCIAENRVVAELELFFVLDQRSALTPQSAHQLSDMHDTITLVHLVNSHIHHTERSRPPNTIATTTQPEFINIQGMHKSQFFSTFQDL